LPNASFQRSWRFSLLYRLHGSRNRSSPGALLKAKAGPARGRPFACWLPLLTWQAVLSGALDSVHDHDIRRTLCEQSHADDAWYLVECAFQSDRIDDPQSVHVEDPVAVVGDHAFAPYRIAAERGNLAGDQAARHRDDFHR